MARKSKALLPKRIGKVKVGKSLRKSALADVLTSKAGQALIAEAVLALGAVATAQLKKSRKAERVAAAKVKDRKAEAAPAAATLTYALGEAVRSFSEALHRAPADRAQGGDGAAWAPLAPSPGPKAAKPHASAPQPPVSPPPEASNRTHDA
jgi:hypothetical protein